jgi:exo-beta-1,3-glucanase (GH17 family)
MNKLACFFVLLFAIQASADLKTFINVLTPNTTSPGCIRFSPYVNGLSPNGGPKPTAVLIGQLLDILVAKTRFRCIMLDDMSGVYTTVIEAAHTRNIKVFGITYISADFVSNGDINEAIRLALLYPDTILGISCGTEIVWRNKDLDGTAAAVNACLQKFRQANVTQPLGYCDTFSSWCNLSEWPCYNGYYSVYNNVDFFGVNEFSWYENFNSPQFTCVSAQGALDNTILRYNTILNLFGSSKPLLLSAYG